MVFAAFGFSVETVAAKQDSTDYKVLKAVKERSVNLTPPEYRLRSATIGPGSALIIRGDKSRPTLVHVIKGTVTTRPHDMPAVVLHAGDGYAGIEDSDCLLENSGDEPAEFIWLPLYRYQ